MSLATEWTQPEPTEQRPMTRDEARQCVERVRHHLDEARLVRSADGQVSALEPAGRWRLAVRC
jgi:hypothetical protein